MDDAVPTPSSTEHQLTWYNHLTNAALLILGGILGFLPPGHVPGYAIVALALVIAGAALALAAAARLAVGTGIRRIVPFKSRLERHAHLLIAFGALLFAFGRISIFR